jgi:uncharacterized protein (TIGR02466 family)
MNTNINFLFPTPIYINKIVGDELLKVQNEIQSVITSFDFKDPWNNQRIGISDGNFKDNPLINFKNFNKSLNIMINDYLKSLGENQPISYTMKESWITKSIKNCYAHIHNHGNCDVSGVYYFKTNKNDGNIFFENPITESIASKVAKKTYLKPTISCVPEVGKFILFPSWLKHGVDTNITDNIRISLSFNLLFND